MVEEEPKQLAFSVPSFEALIESRAAEVMAWVRGEIAAAIEHNNRVFGQHLRYSRERFKQLTVEKP